MPRATIRQRWSDIALIALNRTGMRAPAIFRRIGIPRRAVYGVLRRPAVRPNEVTDRPRSGSLLKGMCRQWLQTGLNWHYGGLTAQKYTDHILGPHNEPQIDNHALADIVVFKPGEGFLANAAIYVLLWTAKGPDINIIESIWSYISRRINGMNPLPRHTTGLHAAVHNEWQSVTQARIRRFSDQRCTPIRAIVQAPDWHVNYYWIVEWIFLVVIICVWNFHYAWCIISIHWSMLESLSWKVIFNQ